MTRGWTVRETVGGTARFHTDDPEPVRSATFHLVDRPVLALGSAQPDDAVDRRVATALGVEVVRRRSGGGAVLMLPGEFVWLDLVLPAGDPRWDHDVARAMVWVGELWQRALASVGIDGTVHTSALVSRPWSSQVCFTSVGTGELMAGEAKLVGVSQRRTRTWARFQSMVHLRWRPELVAALVAPPRPVAADLAGAVAVAPVDPLHLRAALVDALP